MDYPTVRMRRLRKNEKLRLLTQESDLTLNHIVYPVFVKEMKEEKAEIPSLPGLYQYSIDGLLVELEDLIDLSIPAILLFGIPEKKDPFGTFAYDPEGIIQRAVRSIKTRFQDLIIVITDVCLCEYTSHGHCGIIKNGEVDNDETLKVLSKVALSHAQAGADMVAPSDMMDGRVRAIRETLDEAGFESVPIMSYSAKYASSLYGPFRIAAESKPAFGDRKSYQMHPANRREALREIEQDIREGADIVMVKPALFYLDVINVAKSLFNVPIAAYSVSGEYLMVKEASKGGFLDYKMTVIELLKSIKRAGADIIITYFAKDLARWLRENPSLG